MTKEEESGKRRSYHSPADWENLADEEILPIRVRDLGLHIHNSPLDEFIQILYAELDACGIKFHPPCYLADEWLCPDKVPMIGIPFCLAHPRLKHIEQKLMLEVEGGTSDECMKLLRHECGHALNYAYNLFKKTQWRKLFGCFSNRYSSSYSYQPYSKRYVVHLADSYAQAHPDEDFAETFAVWLTPNSNWQELYADWPVIKKLRYIDHLMKQIANQTPITTSSETPWSASRMTSTLAAYYERKRKYLHDDFPGYYDSSLLRLFPSHELRKETMPAAVFLRKHRRYIVNGVTTWTRQRKYDIDQLIRKLIIRCKELGLSTDKPETQTLIEITAFVSAVINELLRPTITKG